MRWLFLFCFCSLFGETIPDKVLICGICKDVEKAVPNTILSAEALGKRFADYRIIIYENNSNDRTVELLSQWAKENKKVLFSTERLRNKQLIKDSRMKVKNRTEVLARARNIVLDKAMGKEFDDYKYIVWADLDFLEPWDVEHLVETVVHPEQEWDAVFAYGAYDLFALRSEEWPIGFELLGNLFWDRLHDVWKEFVFKEGSPWKPVYSAFGGLAIYKREAVKGCRYEGVVTPDVETVVADWLKKAREEKKVLFLKEYEEMLASVKPIELKKGILKNRKKYPDKIGVKMKEIVWFSCTEKKTLPYTCEHIPLHASMILKGRDRLFVNPKLRSHHP